MSRASVRRLFLCEPAEGRHSSAIVLAAKHLGPGWYRVVETLTATARVVDRIEGLPLAFPLGPFAGCITLADEGFLGMQDIGPGRFDVEILRAVETAHGPCLWACSRATYADVGGTRGHVAWGARRSDGVIVAGVASLGGAS